MAAKEDSSALADRALQKLTHPQLFLRWLRDEKLPEKRERNYTCAIELILNNFVDDFSSTQMQDEKLPPRVVIDREEAITSNARRAFEAANDNAIHDVILRYRQGSISMDDFALEISAFSIKYEKEISEYDQRNQTQNYNTVTRPPERA